jgi:hypothetical protein
MTSAKRLLVALAIAAGIYGVALGVGSFLYATDLIGTGATHNDCEGYREEIAEEQGIDEQDVDQDEIERRTEACLDSHELTAKEAFRTEYLFWSAWPALICAVIFLTWPLWVGVLMRQEEAEGLEDHGRPSGETAH